MLIKYLSNVPKNLSYVFYVFQEFGRVITLLLSYQPILSRSALRCKKGTMVSRNIFAVRLDSLKFLFSNFRAI